MPRRWLSIRAYKDGREQDVEPSSIDPQPRFDFAFTSEPKPLAEQDDLSATSALRPTTSGGERSKLRRKPDLTLLIERPKTSHSFIPRKFSSGALLDNSQIGLAFGSPRCPPGPVEGDSITMPAKEAIQTVQEAEPLPSPLVKAKRWNIGSLFRSRSKAAKKSRTRSPQPRPNTSSANMTSGTDVQYSPISPLTLHLEKVHSPLRFEIDQQSTTCQVPVQSAQAVIALAYQTKTLGTSVAQNIGGPKEPSGTQQSRLLTRRSKIFSQLLIKDDTENTSPDDRVPDLSRPVTSPVPNQPPCYARSCSSASAARYSLFPPTPTLEKPPMQIGSPRPTRKRSSTAPSSQDIPVIAMNPSAIERPSTSLKVERPVPTVINPELQGERAKTIQHSHHDSHASSEGDIFFDVKSFGDSHEQGGQQFEMTRPPSAAIHLARSKSNARKIQQEKGIADLRVEEKGPNHKPVTKITSEQLGQTIAALKMLALPEPPIQESDHAKQKLQLGRQEPKYKSSDHGDGDQSKNFTMNGSQSYSQQDRSPAEADESDVHFPVATTGKPKQKSRSDSKVGRTTSKTGLKLSLLVAPEVSLRGPTDNADSRPYPRSMPPSPTPPPVPMKDTNHVLVPKRSSSQMKGKQICQHCTRPVRPKRSNTSSAVAHKPESSTSQQHRPPARAVTVPIPNSTYAPVSKYSSPPIFAKSTPESSNGKQSSAAVAYIKPAAEVAVARTVSLSRRPSAKIVHPTRKPSKREQPKEDVTEKKVTLSMPVVQEVETKHKHGLSLNIVLETATIAPTSPKPPPSPTTTDTKAQSNPPLVPPYLLPLLST